MPTPRPNLRWLTVAIAVVVAVGALAWVLQRDDTDTTRTTRSTSDATSTPPAQPGAPVSSAPPGPTASGTDGPAATPTGSAGSTGGPTDVRSPGKVRGNGGRTGPGRSATGAGAPSGVGCWGGPERAPLSPVPGEATTTEVRHQVAANLQLLREISPPPALSEDVEGMRSYYRRVGQVVGADGRDDGPLAPDDRDRVEQLTQDVYARFAPTVMDFLSRRC